MLWKILALSTHVTRRTPSAGAPRRCWANLKAHRAIRSVPARVMTRLSTTTCSPTRAPPASEANNPSVFSRMIT